MEKKNQTASTIRKPQLSFDQNLWDKLATLDTYNKRGLQRLNAFKQFGISLNSSVKQFAEGLRKSTKQLERENNQFKVNEFEEDEFTTLSLAIQCIKAGVDSLAQNLEESTYQILGDLIEPLETFSRVYQQDTKEHLQSAEKCWDQYQDALKQSQTAQDRYISLKWDVEKCEVKLEESMLGLERGHVRMEKVQRISASNVNIKYKAELATQTYQNAIQTFNQICARLPVSYCPSLLQVQQAEESRINFLKNSIRKIMKHLGSIGTKITHSAQEIQQQADFVNSESDISMFINSQTSQLALPSELQFEAYKTSPDLQKYKQELAARQALETADDSDEDGVMVYTDPSEKVKRILYQLIIESVQISVEETKYLIESCKLPEIRCSLCLFFTAIKTQKIINNKKSFNIIGLLCLTYLDQLDQTRQDAETLYQIDAILQISLLVCMQEGNQKIHLASEIDQHRLWQKQNLWSQLIQQHINMKIKEASKIEKQPVSQNTNIITAHTIQSTLTNVGEGFKMGFSHVKNFANSFAQSNKSQQPVTQQKQTVIPQAQSGVSKNLEQNIAFNSQSMFIHYLANYHISFDQSRDLILFFSQKYDFDKARTHSLLSELESVQKNQNYKITKSDRRQISQSRKERRETKFGNFIVIGLIIPFIDLDDELGKFLRLSKLSHEAVKKTVYKHALLVCQPERLTKKRIFIWTNLLSLKQLKTDYSSLKQKVLETPSLIHSVEEVIILDVQRSAHSMPGVDMNTLTNILKTYALYNPEIEYCQGMNYIVGFLLQCFQNEEVAFKVLLSLADRFRMAELFNSDIPRLKLFFLQLDRMLCMVDVQLYKHFTNEDVTASYFASAWFITIFTNSLKQNTENNIPNESLLQLWDYFLISGWKAIIKLGLFVITMDHNELLTKSFEEILTHISEAPKKVLQQQRLETYTIHQMLKCEFNRIPVSFHLDRLAKAFVKSHSNIQI